MGLSDTISRILISVTADTEDAKKKLTNFNKDVRGGLQDVMQFAEAAREALRSYGEHLRLESATSSVNIGKLSEAFNGLVTNHELLTFAAQTQRGVFALNQEQMETLGKAAVALQGRGFSLTESLKKLQDAAVKGKVGGLDDLGLSIKEGESRAESLKNMMTELNKVIAENGQQTSTTADEVQQLGVKWDNLKESVTNYAAIAVIELSKPLDILERTAEIQRLMAHGMSFDDVEAELRDRDKYGAQAAERAKADVKARQEAARAAMQEEMKTIEMPDDNGPRNDIEKRRQEAQARMKAEIERRKALSTKVADELTTDLVAKLEGEIESSENRAAIDRASKALWDGFTGRDAIDLTGVNEAIRGVLDANREAARQAKNTSLMEIVLGPIDKIDLYKQSLEELGGVFSAFTEAVGAGYEAIVTGQGSVSAAFKKVFADNLMAIGKSSTVEALRETALGFGSLALGPLGGASAAMHFKAAALHGAVAVAAGLAANSIGTSAQVAANEKAADEKAKEDEKAKKNGASGGRGGSDGSGRDTFIVAYLDPFANLPEHQRRRQAEDMIRNVQGNGVVENS